MQPHRQQVQWQLQRAVNIAPRNFSIGAHVNQAHPALIQQGLQFRYCYIFISVHIQAINGLLIRIVSKQMRNSRICNCQALDQYPQKSITEFETAAGGSLFQHLGPYFDQSDVRL
jgi:hypothetical protein